LPIRGIDLDRVPERYRAILTRNPFAEFFDLEVVSLERGRATLRFPFRRELTQYQGAVQGGIVVAYADAAMALAVASVVPEGRDFVTTDLTVQYVRPITGGTTTAHAMIEHAGRSIVRGRATVENETGVLAALCMSSFMIVDPRSPSA